MKTDHFNKPFIIINHYETNGGKNKKHDELINWWNTREMQWRKTNKKMETMVNKSNHEPHEKTKHEQMWKKNTLETMLENKGNAEPSWHMLKFSCRFRLTREWRSNQGGFTPWRSANLSKLLVGNALPCLIRVTFIDAHVWSHYQISLSPCVLIIWRFHVVSCPICAFSTTATP